MASKKSAKAEDRIKSGASNSPVPAAKKNKEAASALASADGKRQKIVIWPEWSDGDINQEKWESAQKGGKDKGGGKSPVQQHYFDDPDGKIIMPQSLPVFQWKRPAEVFPDRIPVVLDPDHQFDFDIMSNNNHILHSETMRWIISQVHALWKINATKATGNEQPEIPISPDGTVYNWRPWEHIYAITKTGKGPNVPAYNAYGKYVVRLYWMGNWRKILIDDSLPFDENENLLLPSSTVPHELWPMLLTKALIKIASLDYGAGSGSLEFGDFSVIHSCTSWLPQTIIVNKNQPNQIWQLLQNVIPEWKLPEPEKEVVLSEEELSRAVSQGAGTSPDTNEPKTISSGKEKKEEKSAGKNKEAPKEKKEQAVKEKKSGSAEEHPAANILQPEVAVFASYHDVTRKQPYSVMSMSEMADHSETLRREGFSYLYSHPVLLNKFRSCPLTPPTPPEVIPAWKQIRPLIKKPLPTSEEQIMEGEEDKPIQSIHVESPFVNHNINILSIPTSTLRPYSSLQRGGTRPTTPAAPSIEEDPPEDPEITAMNRIPSGNQRDKEHGEFDRQETLSEMKEGPKDELPTGPTDGKKGSSKAPRRQSTLLSSKPKLSSAATDQNKLATLSTQQFNAEEAAPEEGLADKEEEMPKEPTKPNDMWIDLDKFCQCFQAIHVYHKTNTYQHTKAFADMKHVANYSEKKESKKPTTGSVTTISSGDERQPQYLFVDSLKPVDVIFCMSALCRWNEPQMQQLNTGSHSVAGKSGREYDGSGSVIEDDIQSIREGAVSETPVKPAEVPPGSMISEWHYWKTIRVGNAFKRMKTTGIKAVSLRLPAGRHCLKMYIKAPLGYHIQLLSSSPFTFGEEEAIMPQLLKDPIRLLDYGSRLVLSLGKVISCFSEPEAREIAQKEYDDLHCPYSSSSNVSLKHHTQMYNQALNKTMRSILGDKVNSEMNFAWRVLNKDCTSENPLGANYNSGKPDANTAPSAPEGKPSKSDSKKEPVPPPPVESDDKNLNLIDPNEITSEQLIATIKLQKAQRGHRVRRVMKSRDPNSKDHQRVAESLLKVWNLLETQSEHIGLQLLKNLFSLDPGLLPHYSFGPDENNHITYLDYNGSFTEHQPNDWFLVFREVFQVTAQSGCVEDSPFANEILLLPKLYTPIPTCCLRIIDNDTGKEFDRTLGERMPPLVYKKNEKGYTFLAVARTMDNSQPAGKWRLRLISDSYRTMPVPNRNELCSQFHVRELRDYYMPNDKNIALRQIVRVQAEILATLELKLSKPEVTVCLQILDKEEEVLSVTGRGHVILPAFLFQADVTPDDDANTSGSRSSSRGRRTAKSNNASRQSSSVSSGEWKTHKYVIQAIIEKDAWPLSIANWAFVETLKQQEREEMKSNGKPREPSPPKAQETKKETPAPKGGKGGKAPAKGAGKNAAGKADSRPESVTFDNLKAHWTLKVVVDAPCSDDISLRKDTERAEQVRAMKKAWEDLEPGRAERAKQSRLRYVNSRMLVEPTSEPVPETPAPAEAGSITDRPPSTQREATLPLPDDVFSLEPPESILTQSKEPQLAPVDLSPYFRGDPSKATFRPFDELMEMEIEEKKKAIEEFKENANIWSEWFKEEKIQRNRSKLKQIEVANKLQNDVDKCREAYFRKREAYRIRLLQEELRRQQELEAAELAAQQQAALESGAPDPDHKKNAKGSARGKKSPNTAKSSKSSGKKK